MTAVDGFVPEAWTRYAFEDTPVYVRDCSPCWFVPNAAGDRLLRRWTAGAAPNGELAALRFAARLPPGGRGGYGGRRAALGEPRLRELWLHLTDRCNMACRHCLFSAAPERGGELPTPAALRMVDQASAMGCRVFALTGGEPFMHPGFVEVVDAILDRPRTQVVVLTNGTLLRQRLRDIARWGPERFHLQVSLDGLPERHDALRGAGAFRRLAHQLDALRQRRYPFTASMCVDARNAGDMPDMVDLSAELGAGNLHFMWLFVRGRAGRERFVSPEELFGRLRRAAGRAASAGLAIDNLAALRTQVFAPPGTIHDGTTAGWESAAVGPDGALYPSAALIGLPELATPIGDSLAGAWRRGAALERVREATAATLEDPLRFLLGGGDSDHAYLHAGRLSGGDPYEPLYRRAALWLIAEAAAAAAEDRPRLRLRMGDILESCGAHGAVALVHSNCLLSTAEADGRTAVKSYYADAAVSTKEDILNPACYPDELMSHIPPELRFRGYGCGSPILEAGPRGGQTVVDLGCGRGVECFIAARLVGPQGKAVGVDMLDPMLQAARRGAAPVARNLGYDNMAFLDGYLEALPLEDAAADLVMSNCVLNLSTDKRRTFAEILRVLKPGGKLVVSDVVTDEAPHAAILNDDVLRGECIAGAMTQRDLAGILDESGFAGFRLLRRAPYREVRGHRFFALTYEALKPAARAPAVRALYRGPMAALQSPSGRVLFAGLPAELPADEARAAGADVAVLDARGVAVNHDWTAACGCAVAPAEEPGAGRPRHMVDCMVCGAPLVYGGEDVERACACCGRVEDANATCANGHFVCDECHARGPLAVIERLCLSTKETDMLALMREIRAHPGMPMHGPEHHGMVPGVMLATYRNLGGPVTSGMLRTGIRRGARVMGGSCAFSGACGAASGVGIGFSLLLDANPLSSNERQRVMRAVADVTMAIAAMPAARCCQRDVWIALRRAAELSEDLLPIALRAHADTVCSQYARNAECLGAECPFMPAPQKKGDRG